MMISESNGSDSVLSIVSQLDSVVLQRSDVVNQLEIKNAQLEWQLQKSVLQISDLGKKYQVYDIIEHKSFVHLYGSVGIGIEARS